MEKQIHRIRDKQNNRKIGKQTKRKQANRKQIKERSDRYKSRQKENIQLEKQINRKIGKTNIQPNRKYRQIDKQNMRQTNKKTEKWLNLIILEVACLWIKASNQRSIMSSSTVCKNKM